MQYHILDSKEFIVSQLTEIMPIDRKVPEDLDRTWDDLAKKIGRHLANVMNPKLAYTRDEVERMINDYADKNAANGDLVRKVPWYKFIGSDQPITIFAVTPGPYYAVRKS
jgi:hypothetical protein